RAQGLIHRHKKISGAKNSFLRAESLVNGFTEGNTDVFDGVVLVHIEIALGDDRQIECPVTRNEIKHVVEKPNAGGDLGLAAAIECKAKPDIGFSSSAMDGGGAGHASFFQVSFTSRRSVFISVNVPIVIRTKPGPMSFERSRSRMPLRSSLAKSAGPVRPKLARRKFPALGKVETPSLCNATANDSRVR